MTNGYSSLIREPIFTRDIKAIEYIVEARVVQGYIRELQLDRDNGMLNNTC